MYSCGKTNSPSKVFVVHGEDSVCDVKLHIPQKWKSINDFCTLDENGEWKPLKVEKGKKKNPHD